MVWAAVKKLFSDPEEGCNLNPDAYFSDETNIKSFQIHNWAWIGAGICMFFACAISFYLIYKHCRNYSSKYQQRYIVRILLMVPIYAIDSFLSFRFYGVSIYFDLARDTYEAFVINTFFCLLVEYAGGYRTAKETFAAHEEVKLIFPLNCFRVRPKRGFLRTLKRLVLQYVCIRPLTSIAAVILQATHTYCLGNYNFSRGYIYITAILFVSVTVAMYALILFYSVASESMKEYKPIGKFLSVKLVIFFSFWQSIAISGLVYVKVIRATTNWSTENVSDGVQNCLICGEMLIAAIAHIYVFSYHPYVKPGVQTNVLKTLRHVFSPRDIAMDVYHSFYPKKKKMSKGHVELNEIKTSTELPSSSPAPVAKAQSKSNIEVKTEADHADYSPHDYEGHQADGHFQ